MPDHLGNEGFWCGDELFRFTGLKSLLCEEQGKGGYEFVYLPHIGKDNLWEVCDHLDWYQDNMCTPLDIEGVMLYSLVRT